MTAKSRDRQKVNLIDHDFETPQISIIMLAACEFLVPKPVPRSRSMWSNMQNLKIALKIEN